MSRKYFKKYKSCQRKRKLITKIKTGIKKNVDVSGKKYHISNRATCSCKKW